MRDLLLKQVAPDRPREDNLNRLRQFLQIILLKILHESPAGAALAFTGGSALRLLHGLQRFSEDLDFSLINSEKYNFDQLTAFTRQSLEKLALPSDMKAKAEKTVHHLYLRFPGLLYDAGLSPHREEKFPIRLEIDTNPPAGWKTAISLLSEFYTFPILHFDLPSSFATKLHACLFRRYAKGRDFYDLMWYLGKKVRPNLAVLNNAIAQTEAKPVVLDGERLKQLLSKRIVRLDSARLRQDVAPFLVHSEEVKLLDPELMQQVVRSYDF
ncbi:MAG: nucleotidyl transferase AbiEii/AbiGii toxin family protein [candidate division KSB1 bacterium]|nr:nucleotidyl transferase AbiEii/AbiGii toxin family protein [candidate division KSB1 bacterium]MDZ7301808.1 nucleotidyl transferase AbiEii/AbiGii toxin family protein [candidate division KSB1 bacterium]MDZ7314166.1 nucleotidyl transferase AbiEii/AbiGii toxin family protein [candidate division KSB1 bacterium]